MKWEPHPYQDKALDFSTENAKCALWLEMGLGKTVVAATVINNRLDSCDINRALVIAPLRVMSDVWVQEIDKWDHLTLIRPRILRGTPAKREHMVLHEGASNVDIINYDVLPNLVKWMRVRRLKSPWQMIVVDEATKIKGPRSKRSLATRWLCSQAEYVLELSGAPTPNGLLDLWAQVRALGTDVLGKSFTTYKNRWFEGDFMGWSFTPRKGAEKQIHAAVDPLALSMKTEDYLELPERLTTTLRVDLPLRHRERYHELHGEMMIQLQTDTVIAANAAVLVGKCLQFSNGAMYVNRDGEYETIHDAKLDVLEDLFEEAAGEPILVPYLFMSDAERIMQRFPQAKMLDGNIDKWNRGEVPMMLGHPASMGHGLNLQHGGRFICWFGIPWSLDFYVQTNARLHRQGQERPVHIYHIICRDTVDEDVLLALESKRKVQDVLLEAVK